MGFKPRSGDDSSDIYTAGAGVLAPAGSAPDGKFLKRGTGVPASIRASALAQKSMAPGQQRAIVSKARIGEDAVMKTQTGNTNSTMSKRSSAGSAYKAAPKGTRSTRPGGNNGTGFSVQQIPSKGSY